MRPTRHGSHLPRAFLFLLLLSGVAWSQQQYGNIIGELHVNQGDFPGRVLVDLQLRGAPISTTYTDEQGKFGFSELTTNVYYVIIEDPRYYPVQQEVRFDLSVSSTLIIQINLTRRNVEHPPDSAQKGSNPYIIDTQEYRRHFPRKALKEFDKGVEADHKGKPDEAIVHYQKALDLAPGFYPAHNNLGSDYLAKSQFDAAHGQFEQAIKLNQADADAHLNLANLYLMTRDYPHALASVQEGLRRQPNSALGQFLLGSISERLGKFPEAERALRQALQLDPKMSRVHLELVNLYLAQKKTPEASDELKAFLKDSPDDPLAPKVRQMLLKLSPNP
jgi:tetratricopeptide (TPR) repeat protein